MKKHVGCEYADENSILTRFSPEGNGWNVTRILLKGDTFIRILGTIGYYSENLPKNRLTKSKVVSIIRNNY